MKTWPVSHVSWMVELGSIALIASALAQPFTRVNTQLPTTFPNETAWADYDADGDMDLLVADLVDTNTEETRLFRNTGGTFTRVDLPPTRHSYCGFATFWGDDNRDGRLDLLFTSSDEAGRPLTRLLLGQSGGTFVATPIQLEGEPLLWADLDNDGDLDILATTPFPPGSCWMYSNQAGTNYLRTEAGFGNYIRLVAAVDVDGDGDLDVIPYTSSGQPVPVFRNDGAGRFTDSGVRLPGYAVIAAAWVDVDGDGDVDFLITGEEFSSANPAYRRLYRNDHPAAGAAPEAPTALSADVSGARVTLRWNRPPGRTTANLRVGSQPGAGDIINPLAAPNGRRLVSVMGNAHGSTNGYVVGLKPGTYFWSVQSVDLSFRTSPFAEERSFTVEQPTPLPPPTISALSHQYVDEDRSLPPMEFVIGPFWCGMMEALTSLPGGTWCRFRVPRPTSPGAT